MINLYYQKNGSKPDCAGTAQSKLDLKESESIEFFKLIRSTKIRPVFIETITETMFLSGIIKANFQVVFSSLILKGLLRYRNNLNGRDYYILTREGEKYLYGEFDIEQGLEQFMDLFRQNYICAGEALSSENIRSYTEPSLSPIYEDRLYEIIDLAITNNLLIEKCPEIYVLTEKGEKFVYKYK